MVNFIWHKLLPVKSCALIGIDALIAVDSNFPTHNRPVLGLSVSENCFSGFRGKINFVSPGDEAKRASPGRRVGFSHVNAR